MRTALVSLALTTLLEGGAHGGLPGCRTGKGQAAPILP